MRKLAGSTWGADVKTLKKLYIGRVRPVLEYGMTAWGTTAKTLIGSIRFKIKPPGLSLGP